MTHTNFKNETDYSTQTKNDVKSSNKKEKSKSSMEILESTSPIIRLGDYMRKRKWSKEKLIVGKVKCLDLVSEQQQFLKELKFKKQNINCFYDKIIIQIEKRRKKILEITESSLIQQEKFIEQIFKILSQTKPNKVEAINLCTQISTISTIQPNISNKLINCNLTINDSFFKTCSDKLTKNSISSNNILQDSLTNQHKISSKLVSRPSILKNKDKQSDRSSIMNKQLRINTQPIEIKQYLPCFATITPKQNINKTLKLKV